MYKAFYEPPRFDVKLKPRPRGRRFLAPLAAAVAAAAFALLYLYQYVFILELNYDAARYKRDLDKAHQERATLKADLYRRRSLAEVDYFAHGALGMRAPGPGQIIVVEDRP